MTIDGKNISVSDINFSEEAAKAANDLITNANGEDYNKLYRIGNGELNNDEETNGEFNITGTHTAINEGSSLTLSANDENEDSKEITCSINKEADSPLICNPNGATFNKENLHGKYGYVTEDGDTKFYLSFDDSKGSLIESGSSSSDWTRYATKSSSGLSGGALAGIVITCVVVLIAAAVAAIMLRKPTPPPVDNATITGLNTV